MVDRPMSYYYDTIDDYNEGRPINLEKLRTFLLESDALYASGKPTPLPDAEYDALHQIYIEMTGEVLRGDMNARKKVQHEYPDLKGTIKKVHYITQKEKDNDPGAIEAHKVLYKWYLDTYAKLDPRKKHFLGFWPKYDGCSIILSLDANHKVTRAITRGDEEYGVDKSALFNNFYIDGIIPKEFSGKCGLKCEAIMRRSMFKKYNEKFGDPNKPFTNERTAITSLLNSERFTEVHKKFLTLQPLMMQWAGEFQFFTAESPYGPTLMLPYNPDRPCTEEDFEQAIRMMKEYIDDLDFACDGVVVRWYDPDSINTLGRDIFNYVNKFEIAYKFPMVNNYTKVIDIRQDIGMLGKVSFTAILEPITINDKVIRHASLGSYERAKGLNLAKGDIVNIKYEIVPYLCTDSYTEKHRSGEAPIELISECPYCHNDLEMNPELSCVNPNCPSRIQGKINNFCIRLNIEGIGPKMIEELFSVGFITSIESLFDIKYREKEFCALDGYGKKTWRKLVKQISNLKITEPDLLACVSISGIGPKKAKDISNIYHIDEILSIAKEPHGKRIFRQRLTPHLASVLYEGVNSNRTLIEFLLGHVKVIKPVKDNFAGIIVFTGFRNPAFQKHLQSLGYEVADSVTKKTNLVIMAGDEVTGKIKRASELGIPIIEVNEAYEKFNFKI